MEGKWGSGGWGPRLGIKGDDSDGYLTAEYGCSRQTRCVLFLIVVIDLAMRIIGL